MTLGAFLLKVDFSTLGTCEGAAGSKNVKRPVLKHSAQNTPCQLKTIQKSLTAKKSNSKKKRVLCERPLTLHVPK